MAEQSEAVYVAATGDISPPSSVMAPQTLPVPSGGSQDAQWGTCSACSVPLVTGCTCSVPLVSGQSWPVSAPWQKSSCNARPAEQDIDNNQSQIYLPQLHAHTCLVSTERGRHVNGQRAEVVHAQLTFMQLAVMVLAIPSAILTSFNSVGTAIHVDLPTQQGKVFVGSDVIQQCRYCHPR